MLPSFLKPRPAPAAPVVARPTRRSVDPAGLIEVRLVRAQLILTSGVLEAPRVEGPVSVEQTPEGSLRITERKPATELHPICRLYVPPGMTIDLQSESSGVTAVKFEGSLRARLHQGVAKVDEAEGRIRIVTDDGSVTCQRIRGGLDVLTSRGTVAASEISGDVQVVTQSGNIELSQISGPLTARSTTGSIEATELGGISRISTRTGAVRVTAPQAPLTLRTQSGDITLEGAIDNHTTVESFKGRLDIRLGKSSDTRIEASARQGVVRTERITPSPGSGRRTLRCVVGSGKARLRLDTGMGVIEIAGPRREA